MMKTSIRNDNGGQWFLARTRLTIAEIERRFTQQLVGAILYKRVGAIMAGPKPYLFIQIQLVRDVPVLHKGEVVWQKERLHAGMPEGNVQICLQELGITSLQPCSTHDVLVNGVFRRARPHR